MLFRKSYMNIFEYFYRHVFAYLANQIQILEVNGTQKYMVSKEIRANFMFWNVTPTFFFTLAWNIRFMSICMQSFEKMALLLFFFYLCYNLITPTFFNNINICSCVHYVLAFEATSKARYLKFWLKYLLFYSGHVFKFILY